VCARAHVCTHSLLYCVFSETHKRVCTCHTHVTQMSHTCHTLAYICSNTKTLEKRVCAHVLVGEYAGVRMQPSRVCTCVTQMSHIYHTHVSSGRRNRAKSVCTCTCVFVGESAGVGIQASFTLLRRGMRVKRKSICVSGVCWKSVCVSARVYVCLEECMCVPGKGMCLHGKYVGRVCVCECTWENVGV